MKVCLFFKLAMLTLGVMKQLPCLIWICFISRIVYPILILNTWWNRQLQMSFILSSQSWKTDSPVTHRKDEIVMSHVNTSDTFMLNRDPPSHCEHCQFIPTIHHILVQFNSLWFCVSMSNCLHVLIQNNFCRGEKLLVSSNSDITNSYFLKISMNISHENYKIPTGHWEQLLS